MEINDELVEQILRQYDAFMESGIGDDIKADGEKRELLGYKPYAPALVPIISVLSEKVCSFFSFSLAAFTSDRRPPGAPNQI